MNKTETINKVTIKYTKKSGEIREFYTEKLPPQLLQKINKFISSHLNEGKEIIFERQKEQNKTIHWKIQEEETLLSTTEEKILTAAYSYLKKIYPKEKDYKFDNFENVKNKLNEYDEKCGKNFFIKNEETGIHGIDYATSFLSFPLSSSDDSAAKKELLQIFEKLITFVKGFSYILLALGGLEKDRIYVKTRKEKIKLTKLHKFFIKKLGVIHSTDIFSKFLSLITGIVILATVFLPIIIILFNIPSLMTINSILSTLLLIYILYNASAITSLFINSYQIHQSITFRNELNKYLKNKNLSDKEKCRALLNFLKEQVTVNETKMAEKILKIKEKKWKTYTEKQKNKKINKKIRRELFKKTKAFENVTDTASRKIVTESLERWLNSEMNNELIEEIKGIVSDIDKTSHKKELTTIAFLILSILCLLGNFVTLFGNTTANGVFWTIVANGYVAVDSDRINNLITSKIYNRFIKTNNWKEEEKEKEKD